MRIDLQKLYTSSTEYFDLNGSVIMKLSMEAALAVCAQALERGFVVARIEGGVWHNPGFEARLDCIWDGVQPPCSRHAAQKNNLAAADFIRSEQGQHDVFVLSTVPIATQ